MYPASTRGFLCVGMPRRPRGSPRKCPHSGQMWGHMFDASLVSGTAWHRLITSAESVRHRSDQTAPERPSRRQKIFWLLPARARFWNQKALAWDRAFFRSDSPQKPTSKFPTWSIALSSSALMTLAALKIGLARPLLPERVDAPLLGRALLLGVGFYYVRGKSFVRIHTSRERQVQRRQDHATKTERTRRKSLIP